MKNKGLLIVALLALLTAFAVFAISPDFSFKELSDKVSDKIDDIVTPGNDEGGDNTDTDDSIDNKMSALILSDGVVENIIAKRTGYDAETFTKYSDNQFWHSNLLPEASEIKFTNTSAERTYYIGISEFSNVVETLAPGETSGYLTFIGATYYVWNDEEYTPDESDLTAQTYNFYYTEDCGTVSVTEADGTVVDTYSGMVLTVGKTYVINVSNGDAEKYISYSENGAAVKTVSPSVIAFEYTATVAIDHYLYCGEEIVYSYINLSSDLIGKIEVYAGSRLSLNSMQNKIAACETILIENYSGSKVYIKKDNAVVAYIDAGNAVTLPFQSVTYSLSIVVEDSGDSESGGSNEGSDGDSTSTYTSVVFSDNLSAFGSLSYSEYTDEILGSLLSSGSVDSGSYYVWNDSETTVCYSTSSMFSGSSSIGTGQRAYISFPENGTIYFWLEGESAD